MKATESGNLYFSKKEEYTKYAETHTQHMSIQFPNEIEHSVNNSEIISGDDIIAFSPINNTLPDVQYFDGTTTDAMYNVMFNGGVGGFCLRHRIWVLNFASYKNPGGMFIQGSSAQEESLCRESFLYNVLSHERFKEYYKWNRHNLNNGLYKNRMIISPDILFDSTYIRKHIDPKPFFIKGNATVITCAAPNYSSILRYGKHNPSTYQRNLDVLLNRIRFVLVNLSTRIQEDDVIILGAFGCGVFKQDPAIVSQYFQDNLHILNKKCKVIFAVPSKYPASIHFSNIKLVQNNNEDLRNNLLKKFGG